VETGVAIVTGAGSGIGRALALELCRRGEELVLVDRDEPSAEGVAREVVEIGGVAVAVGADVSAPDALRDAVIAAKTLGRLRTVCLNAGVTSTGTNVWETPASVLDLMISINLRSLFDSLRLTVPVMASHAQRSRVLITASMAGVVASPGSAAYSASKAGAVAVAKALRAELAVAAPQISVTVLNPGMVRTNLMVNSATRHEASTSMPPELVSGAHVALNEFGQHPDDTARVALDDLDAGCFWSMPPADDPFMETLRRELSELG
jgi:NAD(P)-dependent dehydrogenase (short-subunit alcohol dehydrogenase family)